MFDGRIELPSPPWKGGILTAWLIEQRSVPFYRKAINRTSVNGFLILIFSCKITFSAHYTEMGERGIEPPMFTTRERIYSPPQHHQSLLFALMSNRYGNSAISLGLQPRYMAILFMVFIDGFLCPLKIAVIVQLRTPHPLASCSCVKSFAHIRSIIFALFAFIVIPP